jgi:hypothetical protein
MLRADGDQDVGFWRQPADALVEELGVQIPPQADD